MFGWRIDLMPTHCDIATEHQYMRVGPSLYISYNNKYDLSIETNEIVTTAKGLVLKSEDGTKTYRLVVDSSGIKNNLYIKIISLNCITILFIV
jgi:hypothetical protein